ncbi:UNVERIFIED_CONTAM: hypothetical protein Sindi_0409200 [Sesamum indicum]
MTVADFRPISCCNILYKIIAKLLVQRLKVALDKLISPCQAAFIPGRSIGDNIMLAHELFTGYNQMRLPRRYALKVDIRKAYDTIKWNFLLVVLQLFWFPVVFMKWVEECVTISFSVGMNGKPYGRSTLAIPICTCDGGDAPGILTNDRRRRGLYLSLKILDRFGTWSGLRLNVEKRHLIISQSAHGLKEQMLAVLGFQEGLLSMRYLGLPLISSRVSISDCQPLLKKIDERIAGWEGLTLSYAGRGTGNSGYAKVAWKEVCKPLIEGGQGLRNISTMNRALICKKLCDVIRCDRTSIWVDWLYEGRLCDASIWTVPDHRGSWSWKKMVHLRTWLRRMVEYHIGDGCDFYLWNNPWHHLNPLMERFSRGLITLSLRESIRLSSVIQAGQ